MRICGVTVTWTAVLLTGATWAGTVSLPPGADGLAGAIAAAGRGGTVLVQTGLHTESGGVTIVEPVSIVGAPGAILEVSTSAVTVYPLVVDAAFHVRANGVRIQGLEIRPPAATTGGAAILIEDAASVAVTGNTIREHQFGVLIQRGDSATVSGNTMDIASGWATGALPEAHGVVVINGRSARIEGNSIRSALFGIWACDRQGRATANLVADNFIGLILCNVPTGNFLISGSDAGSGTPGREWTVRSNTAANNGWGYLVIDGANNNSLQDNAATGSQFYDLELTMDTYRFGFLTPASYENTVKEKNLVVKDCGNGNRVLKAGSLVDTTADPCF